MKHCIKPVAALVAVAFLPITTLWAQQWAGSGITEPYRDATVRTTVVGTVTQVNKAEGQFVREGEVIIELNSDLERFEVERRKLIAESTVELDSAMREMELRKRDFESTRQLYEDTRSVSEDELLQKELEYRLAEAQYERLKVAEAREQIEYRIAEAQLAERQIRAPFDGVIVKLFVEAGETSGPQQPLVRIADTRRIRLVAHLETDAADRLSAGKAVRVRLQEFTSPVTRRGNVEFISPVVDPSSGLREVKVLISNSDASVNPGVSGSIVLE
jgi:RND family efflux transporter MFP subunit